MTVSDSRVLRVLCGIGWLAVTAVSAMAAPVNVVTQPPVVGAEVRVDGAARGMTGGDGSVLLDDVALGEHTVELVLPDGRALTQQLSIGDPDILNEVTFSTETTAAPPPAGGGEPAVIVVDGNVGSALVEIDGRPVGHAGGVDGSLTWSGAAGAHRVRLSDDEYEAQEKTIEAEAGLTSRVRFELRHAKASSGQTAIQNSGGGLLTWVLVGVLGIAVAAVAVVAVHVVRSSGPRRVTTRRIDRYEVREQIGRGGMATIYKGLDTTRRGAAPVAIKVMDDSHLTDPDLVHKFLREGEILKQLNEADPEAPLVRVLHYGRAGGDSGRPFIAMELVEGEDLLKHLRRRGRLPQKEAARIVAGVARALVPAHAAGVYHRDLTPDNVILTSQPRGGYALRLIDFGVARHEYTSHGTLDGSIAGKPPFMSPEQCQAIPVDGRSDIYSLGVMLYALLAGAPPFVNRNPLEVMRMHKEEPVSFPADFPPSARVILEKALAKDRNKRQRDISALFSELSLLERLG